MKRYAIRSKVNGALLRLTTSVSSEIKYEHEIEFGVDKIVTTPYSYSKIIFNLSSNKENLLIWYSNRKEIVEKVLKSLKRKHKDNNMKKPYINCEKYEYYDSFEIVELFLEI